MKTLCIPLITLLLITATAFSQKIVGAATYKTDLKIDLKLDSTTVSNDLKASLQAQLRKSMQKEYTLNFNTEASLYTEVEKLAAPAGPSASGIMISFSGGSDILYRNVKESQYVEETEIMSKPFLIKDTLEKPNWELGKEVKNIGDYTCFKATLTRDVDSQTFDSLKKEMVKKTESKTTTAWYTLDIPVQHGPSSFWGLPGLILEIDDGERTILCSRVIINPEKTIVIEAPDKGKVVTQAEYDKIQEKKSAEMMEQFQSGNGIRGNSNSTFIKIGG